MFPPARCLLTVRLLGTCPEGSYTPYPFHSGLGRICRWIFYLSPPSQGNTLILVIVDLFSKSCRLLPLPGLPTALQTAEALSTHVSRHYGVPEDIVSDQGPEFTSRVWKAFMDCLGVSISLTSGFHPESNGQVERVNQDALPGSAGGVGSVRNLSPFQCVL